MRKALAVLGVLLLAGSSVAYAAGVDRYEIPELNMTVEIPEDWAVFTRDVAADDPNLEMLGADAESLADAMEQNGIYLNAVKFDPFSEINIVMLEEENAYDMHRLSEEEIEKWVNEDSDLGQVNEYSIYEHKQARFIRADIQRETNRMRVNGMWYFTIINGQGISVTLLSYSGEITAGQEAELKSVVDSITFTEVKEKPVNWMRYAIAGAIGGAIGAAFAAIIYITKKRKTAGKAG